MLVMAATTSLAAGLLAGLIPALHASWLNRAPSLGTKELTAPGTRSVMRWRGMLMACEIAAALVLTVGAGLLVRSLVRLTQVDLGFQTERVLVLNIRLPEAKYRDKPARAAFFDAVVTRVQTIPGVEAAAFANQFPMRGGWGGSLVLAGAQSPSPFEADFQAVSPGYFSTLGIPLVRGRLVVHADRAGAPHVAVVSETFARQFLPGRDAIGQQFARNRNEPTITIVGVAGDVRRDGKTVPLTPQVYLPAAQTDLYPVELASLAVRASVDPYSIVPSLRRAVWSIDPDQPITNVSTLDDVLAASMGARRFNMILLASLAALALGLALVGVYGVVAHAATQRTREIGIRVALGATRRDVVALVVRDGLGWALAGVVAGLAGASALTRLMTSLLFEVPPTDPLTFAAVALTMTAVALCAGCLPARRAASMNPTAALRAE
jgi:predicted permease